MNEDQGSIWSLDTVALARRLLGCSFWRIEQGRRTGGRIVETEAYLGANDPAAHSRGGLRSARVASMYLPAGHIYVYFTYGMHYCVNIVSAEEGIAEAVLIRALEPLDGLDSMRRRRSKAKNDRNLTNGPAKLCEALGIDRELDGVRIGDGQIELDCSGPPLPHDRIGVSGRVGIGNSGVSHWPLRFYVLGSPWVSR